MTDRANEALRTALRDAGARLARSGVHGSFRVSPRVARPGFKVTFFSTAGSRTSVTTEALVVAADAVRRAGFVADRNDEAVLVA